MSHVINLKDKFLKFSEHWTPKVIAEMNDYQFKLVKIQCEFTWHDHQDSDEVFLVIQGHMHIAFRDHQVDLSAGELFVVPKGVEHKPFSENECQIMIIEPRGVINTGEAESALRAENDIWI
mgnify:CR=1 FL=1